MKKEVKIGFIGLSDTAIENHVIPLSKIENVTFAGGHDTDDTAFTRVKKRTGINLDVFHDVADLIRASDALIICSPVPMHYLQLVGCLLHRRHVLCQAPLCFSSEVKELVSAVKDSRSDLIISTYYPRRFDPLYVWLKEHLSGLTKKYGRVLSVCTDFSYPEERRSKSGNLIGKFYDQDADYLSHLLPCIEGGNKQNPTRIFNSADRYEVCGLRPDGVSYRFCGSCELGKETPYESIEVRFQTATLYLYCGKSADKAMVMEHASAEMTKIELNTERYSPEVIAMKINRNFIDAIRGEAENYIQRQDLLRNYVDAAKLKTAASAF